MSNEFKVRHGLFSENPIIIKEISTPIAPDSGYIKIYPKVDGNMYKLDENGVESVLGGGGSGEINTASNYGTQGTGLYDSKNGVDLRFKNLDNPTGKITISANATNHTLELGVNLTKSDVGLSNVPNTDATNPANISQTSSYRFVTDTEKSTWNGKQPLDGDLTAIAALAGTSGFLKKTNTDTWSLDTSTYLTSNQSITVSGDASGSGTTSISLTVSKSTNLKGGNNTTLLGSIPYQSNTDTTTLLSPNTTLTKKYLAMTGTGTNGAIPFWDTPSGGSSTRTISNKTAAYTVTTSDDFIVCDGTFTVTLFAVSGNSGKQIEIKNKGTGVISVKANASELMDDLNSIPLYQYDALRLVCDGTKWHIV